METTSEDDKFLVLTETEPTYNSDNSGTYSKIDLLLIFSHSRELDQSLKYT